HLRIDKLVTASKCLLQHVASRMLAGLAFIELAIPKQPTDIGVIVRQLFDRPFAFGKIIDPAVADVAEIHPTRREPGEAQCGFHPGTFVVTVPEISESSV